MQKIAKKKSFIPSQNFGLYRNNNFEHKMMESIITAFDEENLKIEFEGKSNMICFNNLDVKLELERRKYGSQRIR